MKKRIIYLFERLVKVSGIDNLVIDYEPQYGGYRLVRKKENGCLYGVFERSEISQRLKAKEFEYYLSGLVAGIEFAKNGQAITSGTPNLKITINPEANEITDEDLEAAAEFYDNLKKYKNGTY